jgi:hypothetical protein
MDPAFGVLMSSVLQSGLMHNGDVYSLLSNSQVAWPTGADYDGAEPTTYLGLMSAIAFVLATHVNKISHNNPHGLTAFDLGFTSGNNSHGYWTRDPSGCIRQWGVVGETASGTSIPFPISFTSQVSISVQVTENFALGNDGNSRYLSGNSILVTGFSLGVSNTGSSAFNWLAIGF